MDSKLLTKGTTLLGQVFKLDGKLGADLIGGRLGPDATLDVAFESRGCEEGLFGESSLVGGTNGVVLSGSSVFSNCASEKGGRGSSNESLGVHGCECVCVIGMKSKSMSVL